ncbi:hypothetical protein PspLS_08889 [Pyricularia sp. CBS 133598]|nr:hypothetical protein PspLS_08889 [Pyricularia sp. CBS 133598]
MEHSIPIRPRPAAAPCRFFASGRCAKGTTCPFAHVTSPSNMARPEQNAAQYSKKAVTCHYFLAGRCTRGDECVFLHQTPPTETEGTKAPPHDANAMDRRSQLPCRYFARGECRSGEACPFYHDVSQAPSQVIAGQAEPDADEQQDDWTRVFGGAIVHYGKGCGVSKVSLTTDFSAVRLGHIPAGSTPDTIIQMLRDCGVDVPQEVTVRIQGDRNADLRAEDPEFARVVTSKLESSGSEITAVRAQVPEPQGSSLHRVDCRRVHCSWYRPMRTVWINFGSRNAAQKVHDRFLAGTFKIDGQVVKVGALTGGGKVHEDQQEAWTVMLTEIDNAITVKDIKNSISDAYRQRIKHVELGKETYRVEATELIARAKLMLEEIGPLESWTVTKLGQGKRIKAQATFADETDARTAAKTLNDRQISARPLFNPGPKLTIQHLTVAKFKLTTRIYGALRDRLEAQKVQWEDQHILFSAYPPEKGHRVLRLQAEDKKVVAAAQKTLAEIISGEAMTLEKPYWAIVTKDAVFRRGLNDFFETHRVAVTIDRRRCQLRLFGNANDRELVKGLITSLLNKKHAADDHHVIELSKEELQWACHGGFVALITHLGGEGKVTFDIISKPKRIVCTGTDADYQEAIKFIAAKDSSGPDDETPARENQEETNCSVCWTPADDAVTTACGHVYCTGCFADMCQSELTAATQYTLCCVGAANTCQAPLPLPELQSHISSTGFEEALEASFTGYIRRHPDLFRYCPTPDCGRIYRTTTTATKSAISSFTCPQCMATTCTACHAPHDGSITCADHRDLASGGCAALERVKKELGVKDCPRCGTAIEKTEGCNHMTCLGCKCHICWKCLETFDTAKWCYDHLSARHGGVFDY